MTRSKRTYALYKRMNNVSTAHAANVFYACCPISFVRSCVGRVVDSWKIFGRPKSVSSIARSRKRKQYRASRGNRLTSRQFFFWGGGGPPQKVCPAESPPPGTVPPDEFPDRTVPASFPAGRPASPAGCGGPAPRLRRRAARRGFRTRRGTSGTDRATCTPRRARNSRRTP